MSNYISIKDFSDRAGVSPQAIYQRLNKDLKDYLKVVDGKKTIDIKGLDLFSLKDIEQDIKQEVDKELLNALQDALKVLSKQLEVKDTQISELNERLKEAQALNQNNQILLGAEQIRTNPMLTDRGTEQLPIEEPKKKNFFQKLFKGE